MAEQVIKWKDSKQCLHDSELLADRSSVGYGLTEVIHDNLTEYDDRGLAVTDADELYEFLNTHEVLIREFMGWGVKNINQWNLG